MARRARAPASERSALIGTDPADDRRAAILHAAIRVLAQDGIAGATTRKIAAAANVNQAMLGYYFGGKDDLLFAVLQELMRQTQQIALATRTQHQDLRAMIAGSITSFWESVEREPEIQTMQLELTLYALRQPASAWLDHQQYSGYCAVVEQLLREGCAATGQQCAVPFAMLARFIIGGLDGIILQFISDRDSARARVDVRQLIAAVIALAEGATIPIRDGAARDPATHNLGD
jgi:AcrR family transcriptional regulator